MHLLWDDPSSQPYTVAPGGDHSAGGRRGRADRRASSESIPSPAKGRGGGAGHLYTTDQAAARDHTR